MTDRTVAKIVVIAVTVLMQIHSIQFWQSHDEYFGWAWSLVLEICMLWLWYKKQLIVVRYAAAMLLIAGTWYVLTAPTITALQPILVSQFKIELLENNLVQDRASLKQYNNNSGKKLGWHKRIDKAQARIDKNTPELLALRTKQAELGADWRLYMIATMEALILLIAIMTQLRATTILSLTAEEIEEVELEDDIIESPVDNCFVCRHITDNRKGCKTTKLGNLPTFPFRKTMKCYEGL